MSAAESAPEAVAPPARGKRLAAGERRAVIIEAAGPLFGERGFAGTTLDDVAAAARVTKPVVYRHFASKKELYLALMRRHEADLPGFFEPASLAPGATRAELVERILDGWLDYVRANSWSWRILFRDRTSDPQIEAVRQGVSTRARQVLAAFIRAEAPTVKRDQAEPVAEFLTAGLAGLVLWWIDNPGVPKSQVRDLAASLTIGMLRL